MNTDRIIKKIKALLARADETRNDNENERAIALRQATALMDKHSVAMVDLDREEDPRGKDGLATGSRVWASSVVNALSKLYGCKAYRTLGARGSTFVVGRMSARTTVLAMSAYVIASIDREARTYRGQGKAFTNAFRKGAAGGVHEQVRELVRARLRGETTSAGTALAVVDHYKQETRENSQWLVDEGVRLSRGSRTSYSSSQGYDAGTRYGTSLSLHGQVSGAGQRRLR